MRRRPKRDNRGPDLQSVKAEHGELAGYYARKRAETAAALGDRDAAKKWCIIEGELEAKEIGEGERRD